MNILKLENARKLIEKFEDLQKEFNIDYKKIIKG